MSVEPLSDAFLGEVADAVNARLGMAGVVTANGRTEDDRNLPRVTLTVETLGHPRGDWVKATVAVGPAAVVEVVADEIIACFESICDEAVFNGHPDPHEYSMRPRR